MPNTPDIDLSALAEALNEKMDRDLENRTSNIRYVVDTWNSGTNWYREWSDGWIEQGGNYVPSNQSMTISFNKPFTNLNSITVFTHFNNNPSSGAEATSVEYIALSNFIAVSYLNNTYSGFSTGKVAWYACGY